MKKLIVFLFLYGICFGAMALDTGIKDTSDVILSGVAAFLLAGVLSFLIMTAIVLYRMIRYHKGSEIKDEGLLHHGGLKSELIPWEKIDELKINMVSPTRVYKGGYVADPQQKVPVFLLHRTGEKKDLELRFGDMPRAIGEIQAHMHIKNPHYKNHDIDLVERWVSADPVIIFHKETERRRKEAAERDPMPADVKEKLDALRASGMSEKKILKEYFRLMEEKNQAAANK